MYWNTVVLLLFVGVASSAPVDNNYLPPAVAAFSGNNGGPNGIVDSYTRTGTFEGNTGVTASRGGAAESIRASGEFSSGVNNGAGGYNGAGSAGGSTFGERGGYGGADSNGGSAGSGSFGGTSGPVVPIISYENNPNTGDGSYSWSYETGNNIKAQEKGYLNSYAPEGPGETAEGFYSYIAPDGQLISVTYIADGNGFVPQGAHIPTSPPIPQEILEALQKNAADEAAGIFDDGSYRGEGGDSVNESGQSEGSSASSNRGEGHGIVGANKVGDSNNSGGSTGYQSDGLGYFYPKASQ